MGTFSADREKNCENPKNLNPEKISATLYVITCEVSGFFDSLLPD